MASNLAFDAVLFRLITIGEAVKQTPDTIKLELPDIPWRQIGRFRDVVVHHYFGVDKEIVCEIVRSDIPALDIALREYVSGFDRNEPGTP